MAGRKRKVITKQDEARAFPDGARPGRRDELLKKGEVEQHRHFDCPLYNACLDGVQQLGWTSFSCQPCPKWWMAQRAAPAPIPIEALVRSAPVAAPPPTKPSARTAIATARAKLSAGVLVVHPVRQVPVDELARPVPVHVALDPPRPAPPTVKRDGLPVLW